MEVSAPRDDRVGIVRNEKREKYVPLVTPETKTAVQRLQAGLDLPWLQKLATTAAVNLCCCEACPLDVHISRTTRSSEWLT